MSTEIARKPRRVGTGSAMDRLIRCASSIALPHSTYETEAMGRGIAIHAFLEDLSTMDRDEAIARVPEEWRDECASIEIDGLALQLTLAAEVSLAYDCETDTARELGRGEISYSEVRDSEIPMRLDCIGVREVPAGRRGLVVDYKSGWAQRKKNVDDDYQLKICALAAARCYDLDIVEVQLIHVSSSKPWVKKAVYSSFQLDRIAAEIAAHYQRALEVRALYEQRKIPDSFNMGEWCARCPASRFCPAKVGEVRALASGDQLKEALQIAGAGIEVKDLRWARLALDSAKRDLRAFERMVIGAEEAHFASGGKPYLLEDLPEGKQRWMGRVIDEGNEAVDGDLAWDVLSRANEILAAARDARGKPLLTAAQLAEIDTAQLAIDACTIESSKDAIKSSLRQHMPKGRGAAAERAILDAMRDAGVISRKMRDRVQEIVTKPGERVASQPLPDVAPPLLSKPKPVIDMGCDQGPYPMDGPPPEPQNADEAVSEADLDRNDIEPAWLKETE